MHERELVQQRKLGANKPLSHLICRYFAGPHGPAHLDYTEVWQAMRSFTEQRTEDCPDECWLLQHTPVYTLGQAGRSSHVINPGKIPIVRSDRGGQVTYHGPGQLLAYPLLDLRRLDIGARATVTRLESAVITLLARYGVQANGRRDAPGVYVGGGKIAALGLRLRRGCSYHGLALNLDLDLSPFCGIEPCGFADLAIVRLSDLTAHGPTASVARQLSDCLAVQFGYNGARFLTQHWPPALPQAPRPQP